jgi:pimeloyl-ACP methyl ester carboxylesterase
MPRRVLWGGQERLLPASSLAQWKGAGIDVVEPPDLGHCPQLEEPRRLARMVREFAACC